MEKEKVTVCIPHFMRENLLRKCLQALRENASLPYRVIIINDGKRSLSFENDQIQVINKLERTGLGAKRKQFAELVETEYLFELGNDVLTQPGSLEALVQALDQNARLAVVSGIRLEKGKPPTGASNFKFIGKFIMKKTCSFCQILKCNGDLFEADYIPIHHTLFRMKALEDISLDPNYELGYSHLDIFLQFYFTDWKCAVCKKSYFEHIFHESPPEYLKERFATRRIDASRKHFTQKWGYKHIDLNEKTIGGKTLFIVNYLNNYLRCPYKLKLGFSVPKMFKLMSKLVS